MRKLLKNIALLAVATVGAVSCNDSEISEEDALESSSTTLYATMASTPETKISFTDNDSEGIDIEWELSDTFTLYDSDGYIVGNFICVDASSAKFSSSFISLTEGESYTAIYPASTSSTLSAARATDLTSEQDGDAIANLDAACQMEAEFTYEPDVTINFSHTKAIMTVIFDSEVYPSKLIFNNGDDNYSVTYSTIEPETIDGVDYYTSYIMIDPCEAIERELSFEIYNNSDGSYDYRTVTTSKAYEAGVRYTARVSTLESITKTIPISSQLVNGTWYFGGVSEMGTYTQVYFNYTNTNGVVANGWTIDYMYMAPYSGYWSYYFIVSGTEGRLDYTYTINSDTQVTLTFALQGSTTGVTYYSSYYFNYICSAYGIGSSAGATYDLATDNEVNPTWIKLTNTSYSTTRSFVLYKDMVEYPMSK